MWKKTEMEVWWEKQQALKELGASYVQRGTWELKKERHKLQQVFYVLGIAYDQKPQVAAASCLEAGGFGPGKGGG